MTSGRKAIQPRLRRVNSDSLRTTAPGTSRITHLEDASIPQGITAVSLSLSRKYVYYILELTLCSFCVEAFASLDEYYAHEFLVMPAAGGIILEL